MLTRLTFNVTEVCNLRCIYCYALGGDYGGPALKMAPSVAVSKLRDIAVRHSVIQLVQFIGGEPLLNIPAIRAVGEATSDLVNDGTLKERPRLSVVTNLTTLSAAALRTLIEFGIGVVVSLDGPPQVHDRLRVTARNRPTHHVVTSNIERLISAGIPFEIETTFTHIHLEHDITVVDLLKYFAPLNPRKIHITPVMTTTDDRLGFHFDDSWQRVMEMELEALRYVIGELEAGKVVPYGLFVESISSLMKGDSNRFCPAGTSNLAISANGTLYTCHMFTNNSKYQSGDDLLFFETESASVMPRKGDFRQCRSCWARKWCRVCLGRMELRCPDMPHPFVEECERTRQVMKLVIESFQAGGAGGPL